MTDTRELFEDYAASEWDRDVWTLEEHAPKAFAALRAVLDLHKPSPFNERPKYVWLITCQTSSRALWPCETYQAITAALEAP